MAFPIGAMLGLCPNGLWTVYLPSLLCATLPPTFPNNSSVDDVAAPTVRSHQDDIDDSPSSSSKWNPPPSAPSPRFLRARAAPLEAFTAEPTTDGEESDSDETVVETEDESTNPKSFIPRNVRKFSELFRIARPNSSTAKHGVSRLRRGLSLDGRGVRLLPSNDDSTGSSPLQRRISLLEDDADGSERYLASIKEKDVELARLRDSLAQKEVDNSDLQVQVRELLQAIQDHEVGVAFSKKTVAEKDAAIIALREQLEHREHQYRKLRQRCREIFRSPNSPQQPSITQRNTLNLDRQPASKQPLDTRTRKEYQDEIARLREKLVECNSRLESLLSGSRSPGSEGTSPVNSPTECRHLPVRGNQKIRAPGMRYCASE